MYFFGANHLSQWTHLWSVCYNELQMPRISSVVLSCLCSGTGNRGMTSISLTGKPSALWKRSEARAIVRQEILDNLAQSRQESKTICYFWENNCKQQKIHSFYGNLSPIDFVLKASSDSVY